MRRHARILKLLSFLVAGAICLDSVYCVPRADAFRGLINASILGVAQAGITAVIDMIIPGYDPNTDTTN